MESVIDSSGGSRGEVLRRIGIARPFMNLLEKWIRKSSIRLDTKIWLHGAFCNGITPVRCTDTVPALQGFLWKLFCFHKYWKRRTVPVLIRPIMGHQKRTDMTHLTHWLSVRSWGFLIVVIYKTRKLGRAWNKAPSRQHWHSVVDTATLKKSMPQWHNDR